MVPGECFEPKNKGRKYYDTVPLNSKYVLQKSMFRFVMSCEAKSVYCNIYLKIYKDKQILDNVFQVLRNINFLHFNHFWGVSKKMNESNIFLKILYFVESLHTYECVVLNIEMLPEVFKK